MNGRRITGSLLAAFLLLATALPSMCGECLKVNAAEACGEKHGASVDEDHSTGSKSATNAECETCAGQRQVATKRIELHHVTSAILLSPGALVHCPDLIALNVFLAGPQSLASHRGLIDVAIANASPHAGLFSVYEVHNPATFSNRLSTKLSEHPLLLALKI